MSPEPVKPRHCTPFHSVSVSMALSVIPDTMALPVILITCPLANVIGEDTSGLDHLWDQI